MKKLVEALACVMLVVQWVQCHAQPSKKDTVVVQARFLFTYLPEIVPEQYLTSNRFNKYYIMEVVGQHSEILLLPGVQKYVAYSRQYFPSKADTDRSTIWICTLVVTRPAPKVEIVVKDSITYTPLPNALLATRPELEIEILSGKRKQK